jgi:hypothetical protein
VTELEWVALAWIVTSILAFALYALGVWMGRERVLHAVEQAYGPDVRAEVERWDGQRAA